MKKITNLWLVLLLCTALTAQNTTGLAKQAANPDMNQLKMEMAQNPTADVQPGVVSEAASFHSEFQDGVQIPGFTIPGVYDSPAGLPPTDFTAEFITGTGVNCEWDAPNLNGQWIGYDDGVNVDGLGLQGGGTYWGAIRWEPAGLAAYDGWVLSDFEFVPRFFANEAELTFMIWEGANAADLVYQQPLSNLNWNEWNIIDLDVAHLIDASTELWIGFEVTHVDAEYPLGYDNGPAVAGFGDMISLDGSTWESISNIYGLDYNFNLKAFVSDVSKVKKGDKTVIAQSKIFPKSAPVRGKLKAIENPGLHEYYKGLLGYNVYRNGALINPEPITGLSFTDAFFEPGVYTYYAKAVYNEGLSEASNQVDVSITGLEPEISVYPGSLTETHNNPPEITTKILTLTNSGDAPLIFEVATSTLLLNKTSAPASAPLTKKSYHRPVQ